MQPHEKNFQWTILEIDALFWAQRWVGKRLNIGAQSDLRFH